MKIPVLIVDDHVVVRMGLEQMLAISPNLQVVGTASNGQEAIEKVRSLHPSVVLMDINMPGMDGLEATTQIKSESAGTRVVVMTMYDDEERVTEAILAGADGYLLKTTPPEDVCNAVELVSRGGVFVKATGLRQNQPEGRTDEAGRHQPPLDQSGQAEPSPTLTTREFAVLELLVGGLTNKEIGARLFIAPGTAKRHVESILAKLGAADRTDAAVVAIRRGWVQ